MSEKEKIENTPEDINEGVQSETVTELDRADQIAERQARENKKREEILDREEALEARKAVGGKAEAGQTPVKKSEDEKWEEGAKERYAGTGYDPTSDDTPTTYS